MRAIVISCEHAGNLVPEQYRGLFKGEEDVLQTHRAWDPGALGVAQFLALSFHAPLFLCTTTRLLIEANRSLHSGELYSAFSQTLPQHEKDKLRDTIYLPFRQATENQIAECPLPVLHLSIHTFTPTWNGLERKVDIGILFDPARASEMSFALALQLKLRQKLPIYHIELNEPYKGTDDGFTTFLRTRFADARYAGIEIEINQKYYGTTTMTMIQEQLMNAIQDVIVGRH
jgi:predicted N-formylglutamate amidohydrolase